MSPIESGSTEAHRMGVYFKLNEAERANLEDLCDRVTRVFANWLSGHLAHFGLDNIDEVKEFWSFEAKEYRYAHAFMCAYIIDQTAQTVRQMLTSAELSDLSYEYRGDFVSLIDYTLRYLSDRRRESRVNSVE